MIRSNLPLQYTFPPYSAACAADAVPDAGALNPPPDAPRWSHGLFHSLGSLQGDVRRLQGDMGRLQGDMGSLQGDMTTLRGDVGRLQGDVGRLQGDMTTLRGDVGRLQGDTAKLLCRTSAERLSAVGHNRLAANPDAMLVPVPHPDTGQLPPMSFPATIGILREMLAPLIDSLLIFYSITPAGDVNDRRRLLAAAIGCGPVC